MLACFHNRDSLCQEKYRDEPPKTSDLSTLKMSKLVVCKYKCFTQPFFGSATGMRLDTVWVLWFCLLLFKQTTLCLPVGLSLCMQVWKLSLNSAANYASQLPEERFSGCGLFVIWEQNRPTKGLYVGGYGVLYFWSNITIYPNHLIMMTLRTLENEKKWKRGALKVIIVL